MKEIVVDTNVFVRANNDALKDCADCVVFLDALETASTLLCVDEGFNSDPARNKSLIGHEYITHLQLGMKGYTTLLVLLQSDRVKVRPKTISASSLKRLNQLIPNKWDRTFVRVTANTKERTLVSHDFRDFTAKKRTIIKRHFDLTVCRVEDVTEVL